MFSNRNGEGFWEEGVGAMRGVFVIGENCVPLLNPMFGLSCLLEVWDCMKPFNFCILFSWIDPDDSLYFLWKFSMRESSSIEFKIKL